MTLRKKKGIFVFRTGEPLSAESVNQVIKKVRQERERNNLGASKPPAGKKRITL